MRLSIDKEDIGYDPLASSRSIKDITLDGYSVMHTSVITADEEQGILIRYRTWPNYKAAVISTYSGEPRLERIVAHGKVKIHLHDGWCIRHGKLRPLDHGDGVGGQSVICPRPITADEERRMVADYKAFIALGKVKVSPVEP